MLTPFGKYVRKLRIDRGELLREMAQSLDVTPAYLSAVENGKRKVPKDWIKKIVALYSLNQVQRNELGQAFEESQTQVTLDLSKSSNSKKNVVMAFARRFDGLNENDLQQIGSILDKAKNRE